MNIISLEFSMGVKQKRCANFLSGWGAGVCASSWVS